MTEREEVRACENTDRELWREPTDQIGMEYYQPSIHVTQGGGIGIDVGGTVHVMPLRAWHKLAEEKCAAQDAKVRADISQLRNSEREASEPFRKIRRRERGTP